MKTAVLGSGGWGTALAMVLADNGHDVTLWSYLEEESRTLQETRENPLLPGVKLPDSIRYTWDLSCVRGCQVVVMATPSFGVRSTASQIKAFLTPDMTLVSVSKGIEKGTSLRMTQIIQEATGGICPVVALSGPSHAEEVGRGMPTVILAASKDESAASVVQDAFMNERFRVYTSPDIVGAQLGGALKIVIALAAGICDGMGFGDNTKAALMTRGLTEIARLGVAMGGQKETFTGLSGVGDLIVTCTSMHSRNRRAGILIGEGVPVAEAMKKVGAVVEGYYAVEAGHKLAAETGVSMPICDALYRVLYENSDPREEFFVLMKRKKRHEPEDYWLPTGEEAAQQN